MKIGRILSGAALTGCLLVASTASASPIDYASFSGTIIDFDGLAGAPGLGSGEVLANQFAGMGVTFDVPNYAAFANTSLAALTNVNSDPNVIWVDQDGGAGGALAVGMNIDFAVAQSIVGLYFGSSLNSTVTLAVYNGATLLESLTTSLALGGWGLEGFVALENSNITRAVVYSTNGSGQNWNFAVDDLKLSAEVAAVPEPASLLLLATGGLGLLAMRQRRKRQSSKNG